MAESDCLADVDGKIVVTQRALSVSVFLLPRPLWILVNLNMFADKNFPFRNRIGTA